MRLPFNGKNRITQGWSSAHYGLDIVGDDDKTVLAVCGGKVVSSTMITNKSDKSWEWGNYVRVDGNDGKRYYYCHLASRAVAVGQHIEESDVIGIMGNTGKSFGAHLHLQVRNSAGKELNVADVLNIKNINGTIAKSGDNTQVDFAPNPSAPNATPTNVCKLLIGFVSKGNQARVETLAKELQVPCIVQNKLLSQGLVKLLVGYVSSGDKVKFELMAQEMAVPCIVM